MTRSSGQWQRPCGLLRLRASRGANRAPPWWRPLLPRPSSRREEPRDSGGTVRTCRLQRGLSSELGELAPALEGSSQCELVRVLKVAPDGEPARDPRHLGREVL